MKNLIIALTLLTTFTTQANCNITFTESKNSDGLTEKSKQTLVLELEKKGFKIVESSEEADLKVEGYIGSMNKFNSSWLSNVTFYSKNSSAIYVGDDRKYVIPLHMLTLSIYTIVAHTQALSVRDLVKKLPSCDEVSTILYARDEEKLAALK